VFGVILDEALDHIGEGFLVGGYLGLARVDAFAGLDALVGGQSTRFGNLQVLMLRIGIGQQLAITAERMHPKLAFGAVLQTAKSSCAI
jgi:hypothetical protein